MDPKSFNTINAYMTKPYDLRLICEHVDYRAGLVIELALYNPGIAGGGLLARSGRLFL